MTKRPARDRGRGQSTGPVPGLRVEAFPALASFVRGYLHEDLLQVHGSAGAAASAFCADASRDERRQLAEELEALVTRASGRPVRDLRRFLTMDLGSRWDPGSRSALVELRDLVRAAI